MQLHERAQELAKTYKKTEAELLEVLIEMEKRRLFLSLGYTGLFTYCLEALALSEAQSSYFTRVARKSLEVPALKLAIAEGSLSLSQARRIVPVLTKQNAGEWIEKAASLPQRELERAVTAVNPQLAVRETLRPVAPSRVELRVGISPEVETKLRRLQDLLSQKLRRPVSIEDVLAAVSEEALERHDPVRKAARAKSTVGKPIPAGRVALPARIKHVVALRDAAQCTARTSSGSRCNARRWLETHHRVPLSLGGANSVENLQTLCSGHHRLEHATRSHQFGTTPHVGVAQSTFLRKPQGHVSPD